MEIDIREYVKNNFKEATVEDIRESIEEAIKKEDSITLPGLGVFFELLWRYNSEEEREKMLGVLLSAFNQKH